MTKDKDSKHGKQKPQAVIQNLEYNFLQRIITDIPEYNTYDQTSSWLIKKTYEINITELSLNRIKNFLQSPWNMIKNKWKIVENDYERCTNNQWTTCYTFNDSRKTI